MFSEESLFLPVENVDVDFGDVDEEFHHAQSALGRGDMQRSALVVVGAGEVGALKEESRCQLLFLTITFKRLILCTSPGLKTGGFSYHLYTLPS